MPREQRMMSDEARGGEKVVNATRHDVFS